MDSNLSIELQLHRISDLTKNHSELQISFKKKKNCIGKCVKHYHSVELGEKEAMIPNMAWLKEPIMKKKIR